MAEIAGLVLQNGLSYLCFELGYLLEREDVMDKADPPTARQLAYANRLGIKIPQDASKKDLSLLIDLKVSKDTLATERHLNFARGYNIENLPERIAKKNLFDRIKWALTDTPGREQELVAWFVFRVYRNLVSGAEDAEIKSPWDAKIQEIADHLVHSEAILKSIRRYKGRDLIWFGEWVSPEGYVVKGSSKETIAYKEAASLLRERLGLPSRILPINRRSNGKRQDKIVLGKANQGKGCIGWIIILAIFFWFYFR